MIDQKRRSLQWMLKERGISADWWTGYETETEWKQGYDMTLRFSRWVMPEQRSVIWRKEVNSWLISRSDKQLALPHSLGDWEHQITPPSLTHLHHHTLKFDFALTNPSWTTLTLSDLGHFLISSRTPTNKIDALVTKRKFGMDVTHRATEATSVSNFAIKWNLSKHHHKPGTIILFQAKPSNVQFTQEKHNREL